MKYSIFILLVLLYSLVSVIVFFVVRMIRREARSMPAASSMTPPHR
jgi:hypothetical protein